MLKVETIRSLQLLATWMASCFLLMCVVGTIQSEPSISSDLPSFDELLRNPTSDARPQTLVRFVNNGDGTVTDTKNNLMWAAKDNGSDINWYDAKGYCKNYRGGGYRNWRLPTIEELRSLYDKTQTRPAPCNSEQQIHMTPLIEFSCFTAWSSEDGTLSITPMARIFFFYVGRDDVIFSSSTWGRALPVRSR